MLIKLKIFVLLFLTIHSLHAHSKVSINAVGIPLADHYAVIPFILATHTTILYKYLKDYNLTMSLSNLQ